MIWKIALYDRSKRLDKKLAYPTDKSTRFDRLMLAFDRWILDQCWGRRSLKALKRGNREVGSS
jgi:hypothetical protein